jgi:phage gpG-like protein
MLDAVEENFAQEGRPRWQGRKHNLTFRVSDKENLRPGWMGAKPRAKSGNKILQKSGRLASSINEHSTNDTAAVGTNVEYAAAHNFGVTTKAHTIAPRNKKALKFGDTFAKKVNHPGSKIPKREFLKLAPDDEQEIIQAIEKHMTDGIG